MEARAPYRSWILVAGLALGCDVYDPSLLDASDAGDGAAPSTCGSRRPPDRPEVMDGPDGPELFFALRNVRLDQSDDAWRNIGFDLDGLCSRIPDPEVECAPASTGARREVDGEDGIDNSFGHNFTPLVLATIPDLEEAARASQTAGRGAILVWVRGYNGQADDPRVSIFISQGVFGTVGKSDGSPPDIVFDGGVATLPDGGPLKDPEWQGNDYFYARADSFLMGDIDAPFVKDDNAYVTDRVLVASLPDRTDIVFSATEQGVLVRLTEAMVAARLDEDGVTVTDATFAGRWGVLDILQTAEDIGICAESVQYRFLRNQIESAADVRASAGSGGESVPCDALSVGCTFDGRLAKFGGIVRAAPIPDACGAGADGGAPRGDGGGEGKDAAVELGDGGLRDGGPSDGALDDGGIIDASGPDAGSADSGSADAGSTD